MVMVYGRSPSRSALLCSWISSNNRAHPCSLSPLVALLFRWRLAIRQSLTARQLQQQQTFLVLPCFC